MVAAFVWRRLILLNSDINRGFIGKQLLFPTRLTHTRRFPKTEWYNYYGDHSLEEKLHVFLKSVGEDSREFPHAYLISVTRFLWLQKSAVSYWYLCSSDQELTAMIMEITNSFFERRNFIFRYKGTWEKDIFGSPFEKVGGLMVSKSMDPVVGPSLQSNLSSHTPDGQVKVTTRLASWGKPVDPLKAPGWTIARLIVRWTHVGAASAPRIVKEALRIRLRGRLTYLKRPEVRPGSIPRKETDVERALELPFRQYLSELASHTSFPVSIKYIPPKSIHFDDITFYSLACTASSSPPTLAIQPLTPRFYTSFPQYDSPQVAFSTGIKATPTNSDESSCRLFISDCSLMDRILATTRQTLDTETAKSGATNSMGWESKMLHIIMPSLRKSPAETFMDRFPLSNCAVYQRAVSSVTIC
ncbi:hypothetical protein BDV40DRAFT_308286 [Aspergillus tamarii]|uniref:Uncharacterized protein n=1 Tax=Aspergillus tamarii TaxID=41984 RepID=A0A5N6UGZ0_ASPTM|nr:hypothetical protein BDV40DRAFT_308286 [Aspergillus tamarii]